KVDCEVIEYDDRNLAPLVARKLMVTGNQINTLVVNVDSKLKLRDIPLLVNRAKENWDIHMSFTTNNDDKSNPQEMNYHSAEISHLATSTLGLEKLAEFYWMLESRHPLILFGVPGVVLFAVGYKLSGDVLDNFQEWNETSLGVGLAVIAITLLGLFAMMVGLILYIMGKQVKQIQAHYEFWPNED
ncbi:MAG: hypothetical protein VW862_07855, partial [Euryarchaeota archaeon]